MLRWLAWRLSVSTGERGSEPADVGRGVAAARGDLTGASAGILGFGALVILPASFVRFDFVVVGVTVCARATFEGPLVVSTIGSPIGCGFLACATARGPAHCGRMGTAMLANTKLAKTVTGRTFSVIFSCLAESPSPKTMC